MKLNTRMEVLFLPSNTGMIKIFIYGFLSDGAWGRVYASLNDVTVVEKGYNRKKTIIQSLTKLHNSLLHKKKD